MVEFIVLGVIILIPVIVYWFFNKTATMVRQATLEVRYDDNETLHYYRYTDFENLFVEEFDFKSNSYSLKGYKYFSNSDNKKYIPIIFTHGLGVGHIQYTTEIDYLVKQGYDVYTFDGQGCLASQGEGLKYFTNYCKNVDDFLSYLENDVLKDKKYMLVGHSMGAHSIIINLNKHKDNIIRAVVLSPYENVKVLLEDQLVKNIKKTGKIISSLMFKQELKANPTYALNSSDILKDTQVETLVVFGEFDEVLSLANNYNVFKDASLNNDNVYFMLSKDRYHRPNITKDAAIYDMKRTEQYNELKRVASPEEIKKYFDELDYKLLVDMDKEIMDNITIFLQEGKLSSKEIIVG